MNVEHLEIFQRVADGDLSRDEALALLMQPVPSPASPRPKRAHALSVGQDALWRHYQLNRGSSAYNMPIAIRLHRGVDDAALRAACQDLVDRHDSLCTTIGQADDGSTQAVPVAREVLFRTETLSVSEQAFLDAVGEAAKRPFELDKGPLFQVTLLCNRTDGARVLLLNVHHIVFDGMSLRVAMDDLLKAYEARVDGRAPQWTAPAASYRDFVQWQQQMLGGDAGARLREYWLAQLAGDLPVPVLPLQPNPAAPLANGHATLPCPVAPALFKELKALARRLQSSLYTVLLAAFQVLLHRYTGQTDVIVGTPVSGRPLSQFDTAVGYFTNVLPIRAQFDGATPFDEFLKQLQSTVQGAHEHSDYPLLTLREDLRRAGHAGPLFRAAFYVQNWLKPGRAPRTRDVADMLGDVLSHIHQEGEYELVLEVVQRADRHTVHFRHDASLFTPSDIGQLASHYEQVLKAIVEDASRCIEDLPLLTAAERHAQLVEWNNSEAAYPRDRSVIDLFESQVVRRPDAVAVIVGDRSWSYRQVSEQVDRVAARLQALGLGAGDLVGVCTSRSIAMLASLLGTLKAGCAYVPLDPAFPLERLTYMVEDSGLSVVLTERSIVDRLPRLARAPIVLDPEGSPFSGDFAATSPAPVSIGPEDRAYVIYTSGSTGQPKGVQVSHRNLTNFLCAMLAQPGCTERDHLLAITTICFDIAALELFLPLVCGGKVEILPVEATRSGIALLDRLKKGDITVMQATPSTWQMVLAADWQHRLPLKVLCGGEALDRTLAERLLERSAALWNLFGPTETTVWSSAARIEAGGPITIGGPIANTRLYVLDSRLQPVPVGVAGELYIGGDGVSLGYLNRPEQTAARFLPDPFGRAGLIYRTGDAARRLPDGRIDYLGRLDHQVKIRGHRVELGEIEQVLQGVDAVGEAVVVLRDGSTTGPQLVAFVVPKDLRRTPSKDGLRVALDRWLPSYLHPSLSLLRGLPRTLNNKVDRSTLARKPLKLIHAEFGLAEVDAPSPPPTPAVQRLSEPSDALSQSPERRVLRQDLGDRIAHLLQIDPAEVDPRVPLGDYGFQSVLFTQLSVEIGRAYGVTVDPTLFYEHKTLASIVDHVHGLAPRHATPPPSTLAEDARPAVVMAEPAPATSAVSSRDATPAHEPIAIVGMSARFPGSEDLASFERKLSAGEDLVTEIPPRRWSWQEQPEEVLSRWGGFIDEEDCFDASFFGISAREAAQMDPQLRLLLESVWSTIEDAGCRPSALAGRQVGVFVGVSGSEYTLLQAEQGFSTDSHSLTGLVPTAMANRLSYFFDFHGPSAPVDTACSSSLIAIHRAVRAIRDGQCEAAIAGGANLLLSPLVYLTLSKTKMLSPDGRCKTFDASADGYVRGEGVATLLLKPLSRALADGDPIHAVIRGSAENHGGRTQSFTAPNPTAQTQLLLRAWKDAGIDPTTIGYLEAHGTGTELGDPVEVNAIKNAFTEFQQDRGRADEALPSSTCGISSVKTRIGHLEAAAGIAGLVHAVVAMKRGRLPGNIQLAQPNPYLKLDDCPLYLLDEERPWPQFHDDEGRALPRRAAVSSFGFGGSNAHLIVEEAPPSPQAGTSSADDAEQLIVLSARTPERLRAYAVRWANFLRSKSAPGASLPSLADLALTLRLGREPLPIRLAVVVGDVASLIGKLEAFSRQEQRIADVYVSPSKSVKDDLSAWASDDDLHELILKWVTKRQWAKLAQLWVRGVTVDWQDAVAPGQRLNGLPTYPFERQRHWFEAATRPCADMSTPPEAALTVDAAVNQDLLYRFDWPIQARGSLGESPFAADPGQWLVFQPDPRQDPLNLGPGLVAGLHQLGANCVSVSPGHSFRRVDDRHYEVPLAQSEDFARLLRETSADAGVTLRGVVFLWSLVEPSQLDANALDEAQNIGLYSALSLMQAITENNATPNVYFATAGAVAMSDASAPGASREPQASAVPPRCAHAPLLGFAAAAALEYPAMHVATIDIDAEPAAPAETVAGLLQEVWWPDVEERIALHGAERRVARLEPWQTAGQIAPRCAPIAARATYLITGGFGMLGLAFAEQLVRGGARHLVLTGRHGAVDASARAAVKRWQQTGVEVATVKADVGDQADVARLFQIIQETMPPLRGVIHAAGVDGYKLISALSKNDFAALLRPKMKGCWLLHKHTRAADLDFFVLCSSISSAWGSKGQSHYAAANAFLDGFAHHRRALGLPAHSFNCGPWDGGMTPPEAVAALARMGIRSMARGSNVDTMLENIQQSPAQLVMADVEWPVFRSLYEAQRPRSLFRCLGEHAAQESATEESVAATQEPPASDVDLRPRETRRMLALDIGVKVAALLGMPLEQLDPDIELNACGFDSIMAIDLRNMIQRDLGVDLPVAFLMDKLCVRSLSDRLVADVEAMSDDDLQQAEIVPYVEDHSPFALTPGQEALWFIHKLVPTSPAYNCGTSIRIQGTLDLDHIRRTFQVMLDRHAALRTSFIMVGETAMQQIRPHEDVVLDRIDASGWTEQVLAEQVQLAHERPFDLENGPLLRLQLFSRSEQDHVMLMTVHHLATDGWSTWVLSNEIMAVYAALQAGTDPVLEPIEYDYRLFAIQQAQFLEGPEGERLWQYWHGRFPGELPELDLPTDRPRPPMPAYRGATHQFSLGDADTGLLKELVQSSGDTLYMVLLAAFKVLLHRYSGQDDIVVGSPSASRSMAAVSDVIGYFSNALPLRSDLSGNPSFAVFLEQVRDTVLGALDHQDYPFPLLAQRLREQSGSDHASLFRVMFNFQKSQHLENPASDGEAAASLDGGLVEWQGLRIEPYELAEEEGQFDISLVMWESAGSVHGALKYDTDLFNAETIRRLADNYLHLLRAIGDDPSQSIAALPMLSDAQRTELLRLGAPVSSVIESDDCTLVHASFEAQAASSPEAEALVSAEQRLTNAELNTQANQLARHLQSLGLRSGACVGIQMKSSTRMIVAVLAVLKAGGAYVPLEPDYPRDRLADMIEDADVQWLLCAGGLEPLEPLPGGGVVQMDREWDAIATQAGHNLDIDISHDALAYIVFTSGSTGRPKGVAVTHGNFASIALAWQRAYRTDNDARHHLQMAPFSFDVFSGNLARALCSGGKLVLCPRDTLLDPEKLYQLMLDEHIDCAEFVPVVLRTLATHLEQEQKNLHFMRLLIVGSDAWTQEDADRFARLCGPKTRLVNSYGASEATIDSTFHEIPLGTEGAAKGAALSIGKAFDNTQLYVVDEHMQLAPRGAAGELCIGGSGVARGYLKRPELNTQKFLPNPFVEQDGKRIYRTGDRVRWLSDGNLAFLGRCDFQVKLRGFRIEPGEIEGVLAGLDDVQAVAVIVREDTAGDKRLVAYVVGRENVELDIQALRRALRAQLPDYMIPGAFVVLPFLPVSANGKVDRKALPAPRDDDHVREDHMPPRTDTERALCEVWQQVLGMDKVGVNDSFFALGGHSLLAMRAVTLLNNERAIDVSLAEFMSHASLADLAVALDAKETKEPTPAQDVGRMHALLDDWEKLSDEELERLAEAYVAPRTDLEKRLCELWQEVLEVERVGITDNFFLLGGNSLSATRLIAQVNQAFTVALPLQTLFTAQTLEGLAEELSLALPDLIRPALRPVGRAHTILPSYAQQRLWLLDRIEGGSAHYNMPGALRLLGQLDLDALRRALSSVLERHESLRTCFSEGEEGEPVQIIQAPAPMEVSLTDLSMLAPAELELQLAQRISTEALKPFDLARDMMLRAELIRLAQDEHVLLVTMHHIASDGWSMAILINEFSALYSAYVRGEESPLSELEIQYADYAHWQRSWLQGEVLDQQLQYWTNQLVNLPAVHSLPLDRPRPKVQSFVGETYRIEIAEPTARALIAFCQAQGATLFMGLHAAFSVLLSRYSNETDIVVGSPIANREQAEVANLIGFFVNTLVLRSDLSGDPSFKALLEQSKAMLLQAYSHQQVPFEQLVERLQPERSLSHSPLFQIMLVLQNNEQGVLELPDLTVGEVEQTGAVAKYDLTLMVDELDRNLRLSWQYNTDLFDAATIERMAGHFQTLLSALVAEPEQSVFRANMLSDVERHQLLLQWNDTAAEYPNDKCVHELFEAHVEQNPQAVAVVFEDQQLTYQELNIKANRLAHYLVTERQMRPDTLVGICVECSLEMVIGILGILKAGGAYVPLDPEYPEARLRYMLEDATLQTVLTQNHLLGLLPFTQAQALSLDNDEVKQALAEQPEENLDPKALGLSPDNLAYVIYTSGSTGNPKGVMVEQRSVTSLVLNSNYLSISRGDVIAQASSMSFDAMTFELWGALLNGAKLVHIAKDVLVSAEELQAALVLLKVNTLFITTALFNSLANNNPAALATVEQVLFGGEDCSLQAVQTISQFGKPKRLLHVYGPTENTTFTLWKELTDQYLSNTRKIALGQSLSNNVSYVLDNYCRPAPLGVAGELYVGGSGLARGYLNRPELTTEKFVENPFYDPNNPSSSERLYRTGDLVRLLPDGNLEFLGRIDNQVKIRGFRIELGEIEHTLTSHPSVEDAVVLAREIANDKRLVAYVTEGAVQDENMAHLANTEALREYLAKSLPEYMIPSAFVRLDHLPLTPNGKVDHKALPDPDLSEQQAAYVAPRTDLDKCLCELWQEVLGLERVGITDNFFHLGGHSLLVTRLQSRMRQRLDVDIPVQLIFSDPTVKAVSELVEVRKIKPVDLHTLPDEALEEGII